jgi:hypothetical protein
MLIVCNKEGQLCNRLFHFSHLTSFALENNEILFYPYIDEYNNIFKNLQNSQLQNDKIIVYSSPLLRWSLKFIRWILTKIPNTLYLIRNDSDLVEVNLQLYKNNSKRIKFLSGWLLRDYASLSKHKDYIKNIFRFDEETITNSRQKISNIRTDNSLLIGIHIRRDDYRYYLDGKYFYDDNVYLEKIKQMRTINHDNKNIHFIICTNDTDFIKSKNINGPDITYNQGNKESDLYVLSQCDLIIGPPSTFSGWASFYGSVPLNYIMHKDQIMKIEDFKIIEG